jgi:gingipain R
MKKFILLFLAIFVFAIGLFAQNQILNVSNNTSVMSETVLLSSNNNQTVIQFNLNQLELFEMATGYGNAFIPMTDEAPMILQEGTPELFYLTATFIIPDKGGSELEISYGQFQDFENVEIAPSKGNLTRNIDPSTVPFIKGEVYQIDGFFPGTLAILREPFIMRDVRGQSLDVYPVQYNPVTKVLRVYSEITVAVVNTREEGINEFTTQKRHNTIDPQFSQMYNNLFINSSVIQQRGYPTGEEGELLIICHTPWVSEMKEYIDWKRTIGRKTTIVSTAETGTNASAIKSYIAEYYNNPANDLAYVLLVGDSPQIPAAGTSSIPSDNEYVKIKSGQYLDVLIGRMSCENTSHLQTQIERSVWYEKSISEADTWLSNAVGIASYEGNGGGHDGGEADYVHMNNIRNRLLTYGYNIVHQEYTTGCGIPATSNAQISSRFDSGVCMANYCNHGSETAWTLNPSPTYSNTQVNALQNAWKLPYIFSVACVNGKFMYSQPCFAEAWMRATKDGQPTGAISTFMSTVNQSWLPPMTGQDIFVNICMDLPSPYGNQPGIKRTIAGAMLNASQGMYMKHGSSASSDYNAWIVFGDPTLMFRTKTPEEMTISHLPVLVGTTEFSVTCDVNGANATLSYIDENDEVIILGTAVVENGTAEFTFNEPIIDIEEVTLAVTGFNKVTYLETTVVIGDFELLAPLNLAYTVEKANHVILSWDVPEGKGLTVTGYNVYRDGEVINPEPVRDEVTFTDVVPANGEYEYEVTAIYADKYESDPTVPVIVNIIGMCEPFSENIILEEKEDASVLITWVAPKYDGEELAGYNVFRDEVQINEELLPNDQFTFPVEGLELYKEYCFWVEVVYNDCEETILSGTECITLLSVKEFPEQLFQIFPNPASAELNIAGEIVPDKVSIYSNMGQLMYETEQCTANMQIPVSTLSSGIYFIKIDSEKGSMLRKVLVRN